MDAIELDIHRQNTAAFIAQRPSLITLTPKVPEKVRTPSGGWKQPDAADRDPQVFRIIELGTTTTPPQIKVQDGTLRDVAFWLLGDINAEVEMYDHWTGEDDRVWTVYDIIRSNEYETRCVVVEYGE